MSFKEQLEKDIKQTFINTDEFAERHVLDGKEVDCIVDSSVKNEEMKYQDGTATIYKSIAIASDMLDSIPIPNEYLSLDDELFKVSASCEMCGMAYIDLSNPIGKFDKPIRIFNATTIEKGGGWTETAIGTLFVECKAYIRNQSGDEIFRNNTKLEVSQTLFKIPYVAGIEKSMILEYKDKHYDILHIDNIEENNVFIDLVCEKVE